MSDNFENLNEVAVRCRELREISDVSVTGLSAEIGVPEGSILAYESGEVDIPISYLTKLAQALHVEVTDLITGGRPRLTAYSLTRAKHGVIVERFKEYQYEAVAYNFRKKKCDPYIVTVQPDEDSPWYLNSHEGHEFDYVIEGKLKFKIEDTELDLDVGDSIYLDSRYSHAMKAIGSTARFLAIVLP